jgi:ketosteroid isomerase-like protein
MDDVVALPENARRLAAEFPERVTVVEIPHAGHALLPEQPEQVEKAILAYLRSRAQTKNNAGAEQQVRKVEEERRQAILGGDTKALGSLMAPEYTAVFSLTGGRVTTKADELAMDQPRARKVESWNPTDVSIRIYGDVGLVIGLAEVTDLLKGERRHIRFRYTHVWVKRNGSWQLVHRHTTRVATIEGPEPPR